MKCVIRKGRYKALTHVLDCGNVPSVKRMFKPRGGCVGTPVVKIRTSPKFRLYVLVITPLRGMLLVTSNIPIRGVINSL